VIELIKLSNALRKAAGLPWSGVQEIIEKNRRFQSILNGIIGDKLEAVKSRWAIPMSLRGTVQSGRICVLAHGLCDDDATWNFLDKPEESYGSLLQAELDFSPFYLRYNSGLHISTNGRRLAALLNQIDQESPEPIRDIVFIGHSMGGLVVRSACHYGKEENLPWVRRVRKIFLLGTPHLGTDLEKLGNLTSRILKLIPNPFTRGIAFIGDMRSAGIKDLRFGYLCDEDWKDQDPDALWRDNSRLVPLLDGAEYHLIAANLAKKSDHFLARYFGDGLVPSRSAAGKSFRRAKSIPFSKRQFTVIKGLSHGRLTNDEKVYLRIRDGFHPKYL